MSIRPKDLTYVGRSIQQLAIYWRKINVKGALMMLCAVFILGSSTDVCGQQNKNRDTTWPIIFSATYLINASAGATLAIHDDLRQEPFGIRTGRSAKKDFWLGTGTALSPGFIFLVSQSVFSVLSTRSGQTERIGLIGLTVHGVGYTIGALAEPITYQSLRKPRAKPARTIVVISNVVLPAFMAYTALKAL